MQLIPEKNLGAEGCKAISDLGKELPGISSIEELVLRCLNRHLSIDLIMNRDDDKRGIIFGDVKEGVAGARSRRLGGILIFADEWKSWGRFSPLNTAMHHYADRKGCIPDLEWFEARDKRLRIKVDEWEGQVIAPPGSLRELVMSYLLTEFSVVSIKRELAEIQHHVPDVAMLRMQSLPPGQKGFFLEEIAIRLDYLERLVTKRSKAQAGHGKQNIGDGEEYSSRIGNSCLSH